MPLGTPRLPQRILVPALLALLAAPVLAAPVDAPVAPVPPAPASTAPRTPVTSIRNKLSAGDLYSAEAIAEVWRLQHGADGPWLAGYSWLARGALELGDTKRAQRYADSTRAYCAARIATGATLANDDDLETALGAAIEVHAQLVERHCNARSAAAWLRGQIDSLADAPPGLRARLHKRLHLLSLTGRPAPELSIEETVRGAAPSLAALRGRPVLLFLFNSTCGDCRMSAPTLERVLERHRAEGLACVALTRWYDEPSQRPHEKAAIDSTWSATYAGLGDVPVAVGSESMIAYGGSSTPTFVFVDRAGIVRRYAPVRLTEAEFEKTIALIAKR